MVPGSNPGEGTLLFSYNPCVEGAVACADTIGVAVFNKEFSPHRVIQAADTLAFTEGTAGVNSGKRGLINLLNHLASTESQDKKSQDHNQDYAKRND